jgi:hypothetical protein
MLNFDLSDAVASSDSVSGGVEPANRDHVEIRAGL